VPGIGIGIGLNVRRGGGNIYASLRNSTSFVGNASRTATVFQADGVTPVSAADQAVSLMADAFEGLELGAELVTNGTFDTDLSGWTSLSGATSVQDAGVARVSKDSGTNGLQQAVSTVAGRGYVVEGIGRRVSGGNARVRVLTPDINTVAIQSTSFQPFRYVFIATSASTTIRLTGDAGASVGEFDNISVREITNVANFQNTAAARPLWGFAPRQVRNILTGTATMATQTRAVTAAEHTLSFRGTGTVTLTGASTAGPLVGTGANDIVTLTFTPTAGNLTLTVSGTVNDAQLELGAVRTTYQAVDTSTARGITEAGVPSFGFLSFDGSDDAMDTPALDAGDYTVILPGRGGIYVSPPVTLAGGDTIRTGALDVTKNGATVVPEIPLGIVRAASTVPWSGRLPLASPAVLLKSPLTAEELNRVLRYYQAQGCGGRLAEGPDTAVNGGFAADTDWTKGTGWTIGSGVATKTAGTAASLDQAQTLAAGTAYVIRADITRTAGTLTPRFTGGTTVNGPAFNATGAINVVIVAAAGNTTLGFNGDAAFAGTVDNVSLRALNPEALL